LDKDHPLTDLEARYRKLEEALESATGRADSVRLIRSITKLYGRINDVQQGAADLKKRLRTLVERNQWLSEDTDSSIDMSATAPSMRSDRLNASTFTQKGWDCIAVGDYENAKQMLTRAVELAPDDLQALSTLGWAQAMSRDYDDALMTYQRVLAASPDDELARVNLGYICLKKEIYGEAVEHLSTAIRRGTDRKATLYGNYYLGLAYLARGMNADAEDYFTNTIKLGPAMTEAFFQLGRARYLAGRKADAISAWRDGIASNSYSPWGKRCSEAVQAVEGGQVPSFD
jgi:tetratricopeptide (TPR) repeat protein